MKKILIFIAGIAIGILISISSYSYLYGNKYVTLSEDYSLSNGGLLKKGTKIKYKTSFSEGFTQYIMYLNIPSWTENEMITEEENFTIIPYWTEPIKEDSLLNNKCDSIFDFGERMPKFKGDDSALLSYNLTKIAPIIAESNKESQNLITRLHYSVIISKEGEVLEAEIITKIDEKLKDKLEKELLKMPDWTPGEIHGKVECMKVRIPISCIKWE